MRPHLKKMRSHGYIYVSGLLIILFYKNCINKSKEMIIQTYIREFNMKLMEILNEVKAIENAELLAEARKKQIKVVKDKIAKSLKNKSEKAEKIATKLRARKGNINWSDEDIKTTRNEVVAAFMANDSNTVIKMMENPTEGYKTIEILKALAIAHGGYEKLEVAAGKAGKKDFIKTVFAYIEEPAEEDSKE